jgi:hypothetical protein
MVLVFGMTVMALLLFFEANGSGCVFRGCFDPAGSRVMIGLEINVNGKGLATGGGWGLYR